ncbi:phage virion morphogenesis protein, partial [Ralstonia solanacearum]
TFAGNALRIATVHQFGLRDRVNKTGLTARYPARELLGFDERDVASIAELISRTLSD